MSNSFMYAVDTLALGRTRVVESALPIPTDNEVQIKVYAVGLCGSDASYLYEGQIGKWKITHPYRLGHELSGVVSQAGKDVDQTWIGQRVAVEPSTPCRRCYLCTTGKYHLCPDLRFLATPPEPGCLSQYITIDAGSIYAIPDSMTYEEAALLEPTSVAIWACKRAGITPEDVVHVTGAGPVGILSALIAKRFGSLEVSISDVSTDRLRIAEHLGLETKVPENSEVDVLIECSGAQEALDHGYELIDRGGRIVFVGIPSSRNVTIPLSELFEKEVTFYSVARYANTWPLASKLVSEKFIEVEGLITHRFGLRDTQLAFEKQRKDKRAMKVMVFPQQL